MRVKTLGALGAVAGEVGSTPVDLPSSQSVLGALRGEPGGWTKVFLSTLLRTLLIAPGMWFAGGKGWRLWAGAASASTTITVFLFFWYAAQENGRRATANAAPAPGGALPSSSAGSEASLEGLFGRTSRR